MGVQHEIKTVDEQVTAERLVDTIRGHSHLTSVRSTEALVTTPNVGVGRRSATISPVAPTDRQLDGLDRRLLDLLAADGRATMTDLGRLVGLSRTAVLARIQRLERVGVIRGYRADVVLPGPSPAAHRARVGLVIHTADVAAYVRRLRALPGVSEVETVTGEYDLILLVTAPSAAELDTVLDTVSSWRETRRTTTWVVLKRYT
jgi:DNA-binding Lrp family transcriptional regulator